MVITIACGDPSGVGPEVALKALAQELPADACQYLVYGDPEQLLSSNERLGLRLTLETRASESRARVRLQTSTAPFKPASREAGSPAGAAAQAAMTWLTAAAQACLRGEAGAVVTAPVCKETIIDAGYPDFVGQTEYLAGLAGVPDPVMMLLGADDRGRWLRVSLATIHIPLKEVAPSLTAHSIETAIARSVQACRDLGLSRARIGVCGLNPHAGEGGKMGTEEQTIIGPALQAARACHADIEGPLPADTLFYRAFRGEFDAVVAMYHDQGLAPLKMIAFESGVNWTLGLPFVRTSPDHGTAFDIAGKGIANPSSMVSALRLAKQLIRARTGNA